MLKKKPIISELTLEQLDTVIKESLIKYPLDKWSKEDSKIFLKILRNNIIKNKI